MKTKFKPFFIICMLFGISFTELVCANSMEANERFRDEIMRICKVQEDKLTKQFHEPQYHYEGICERNLGDFQIVDTEYSTSNYTYLAFITGNSWDWLYPNKSVNGSGWRRKEVKFFKHDEKELAEVSANVSIRYFQYNHTCLSLSYEFDDSRLKVGGNVNLFASQTSSDPRYYLVVDSEGYICGDPVLSNGKFTEGGIEIPHY